MPRESTEPHFSLREFVKSLAPDAIFNIMYFWSENEYFPNVLKPTTFNEKVLFKMLFDRRSFLKLFCDKYLVRNYVQEILGTDRNLAKLYSVYEHPDQIELSHLPDDFIIKPNHGSGWYKVYRKDDERDLNQIRSFASFWLSQDYYKFSREWCYKEMKRVVLVEELLLKDGEPAPDLKFICINGRVAFIDVNLHRFKKHVCAIYDAEWNKIDGRWGPYATPDDLVPRPACFEEMKTIAEKLSAGTDLVRVDLFDTDRGVYFGELTNYPGAARDKFEPLQLDEKLGQLLDVPRRYV